jgi:REP element-mobilizing transposase RayT
MPRKARIDAPGALHHIIVKGINRRKIFFEDFDRDDFLDRRGNILSDTQTGCFAWSFITNHTHMLLRFGLTLKEFLTSGKQRKTVTARSVLSYWGTRELGISAADISTQGERLAFSN